ncbi:MAG TPA: hypothetical protein VMK12_28570 [Anaeromyxobacteraceae bacterium]|nr:hypothetical protein [Anaeromyxobacteraceae bacterium]
MTSFLLRSDLSARERHPLGWSQVRFHPIPGNECDVKPAMPVEAAVRLVDLGAPVLALPFGHRVSQPIFLLALLGAVRIRPLLAAAASTWC